MRTKHYRYAKTCRRTQLVGLRLLSVLVLLFLLSSCGVKENYYTFGNNAYSGFNMHKTKRPLLVLMPEVQHTLLDQEAVNILAKKYRVLYIPFAEEANFVRQMQIDGMTNRLNYYSEALQHAAVQQNQKPDILLCEGFNSLLMLPLALSHKIDHVVAVNGFYPNVYETLINSCYGAQPEICDSLQKHLQIIDKEEMDLLIQHSYKSGSQQQFGQHTSTFWEQAFKQNMGQTLAQYQGTIVWITTTSSGILSQSQIEKLNIAMSSKAQIKLVTKKTLAKNWATYISN